MKKLAVFLTVMMIVLVAVSCGFIEMANDMSFQDLADAVMFY